MDVLGFFWIPDFIVWIVVIAIAAYIYGTWPYSILSSLGYTGPKPLPFVGNLGIIFPKDKHFAACDMVLKAQYGDMVSLYEGRNPVLVVYDPEVIKHILVKDFTNFCDRRKLPLRGKLSKSLVDLEGDDWRRVRSLSSPFFTARKIKHHMVLMECCIVNMLAKVDTFVDVDGMANESLDTKTIFGEFTMESILLTAFGVRVDSGDESANRLINAAKQLMRPAPRITLLLMGMIFPFLNNIYDKLGWDMFPKGAMPVLQEVVTAAIEERKKSDKHYPDFIQALIVAHEEMRAGGDVPDGGKGKALTDDEVLAQALIFLLGGYDTISTAISYLMFDLANNQHWQERVVEEIDDVIGDQDVTYDKLKELTVLDMCIDECMRITPLLYRYDRRAVEDITIKGHVIPKGCLVVIPVRALHHDPDLWNDPETFDPERFLPERKKEILNSYIYHPFGIGPRSCVGMRLALIEVKMAAVKLLQKYKWTVSKKTQVPLELDVEFFPSAKGGIWLDVERREG